MLPPERDVITRAYEPFYHTISHSGTLVAPTLKCKLARQDLLCVSSVSTSLSRQYREPGVLFRFLNDGVSLREHLPSGKHVERVFRQPGLPMPSPLPSKLCRHDRMAWLCRHVRSKARPDVTFFLRNIKFECNGDANNDTAFLRSTSPEGSGVTSLKRRTRGLLYSYTERTRSVLEQACSVSRVTDRGPHPCEGLAAIFSSTSYLRHASGIVRVERKPLRSTVGERGATACAPTARLDK